VPVLINPVLRPNEVATVDLRQRDYILDGVDGFDFLQTKAEGVPVTVNPDLRTNEAATSDLHQRDYIIDGVSGFDFVQMPKKSVELFDDTVVL